MFDAIEDIPSERLVEELLYRSQSNLAVALVEIAAEMRKGENADIQWLKRQAHIVELGASLIKS